MGNFEMHQPCVGHRQINTVPGSEFLLLAQTPESILGFNDSYPDEDPELQVGTTDMHAFTSMLPGSPDHEPGHTDMSSFMGSAAEEVIYG